MPNNITVTSQFRLHRRLWHANSSLLQQCEHNLIVLLNQLCPLKIYDRFVFLLECHRFITITITKPESAVWGLSESSPSPQKQKAVVCIDSDSLGPKASSCCCAQLHVLHCVLLQSTLCYCDTALSFNFKNIMCFISSKTMSKQVSITALVALRSYCFLNMN